MQCKRGVVSDSFQDLNTAHNIKVKFPLFIPEVIIPQSYKLVPDKARTFCHQLVRSRLIEIAHATVIGKGNPEGKYH